MRDNWKIVQFEKLGHTFGGLTNKSADDFGEGKPYIPYLNIFENGKIDPDYLEYVKIKPSERQNKVQFGDLFFTTSSETPHEVGMTSVLLNDLGEAYLNSFCFGFRLQNFEDLSPEFAAYLFRGNEVRKTISDLAQGSTRYNLSKSILFDKLYLNLPPLPQQRKIAKILSTCDTVIAKTEEAIAKYQAIKQGMMHDLFTRGIDLSTGKLRPKYQDAPELYKESELGMIPKDWEVKRLEEVGSVKMCKRIFSYQTSEEGIIPFYKIGTFGKSPDAHISRELFEEFKEKYSYPSVGSILISASGTIGRLVVYSGEEAYYQDSNIVWIENNEKLISNEFLRFVFPIVHFQTEGGTIQRLYNSILENGLFPCPLDHDEQGLIISKLTSLLKKIDSEQQSLSKYKQIKSGLMQDLLSGKVEVSVSKKEDIINA